ncbi:ribonuclease P [Corynebacterium pseudopelargi]|uniref:Ribonuclease P n=2 Tax=Corynebacterium TaxID=1716 RepID=A0A3G6IXF5_9CORY|nr:ribonuclease P [Corynebacterium pseudopelargi]QAU53463.1 ribonuclease P [Corynebacterium pelargi]GGG81856.1 hypothetical protein GCM10007338_20800 [Corynebacterium pelargi]
MSKAVGNAVLRHRTSRKLRALILAHIDAFPDQADIVIRALPKAGQADFKELETDVLAALKKIQSKSAR